MGIKVGDYIEGYEHWGKGVKPLKMRLIVSKISEHNGEVSYYGQADDPWKGKREGCIKSTLGEVRVITDEKPFTVEWWSDEYKKQAKLAVWPRTWNPGDVVKHFKGEFYRIIKVGVHTETEEEMVIYTKANGTDKDTMWVRPKELFDSAVDKNKYPDAKQEWKFEIFILAEERGR